MAATGNSAKLRFLGLHGYTQNGDQFRNKTGSWRKSLKSQLDMVFLDAPYKAQPLDEKQVADSDGTADGLSWWTFEGDRPSRSANIVGWDHTYDTIATELEAQQPVHGLFGFSQGATAAALFLCTMQARGDGHRFPHLRCAILIGGFLPHDVTMSHLLRSHPAHVPSLHIMGAGDSVVPMELSIGLQVGFSKEHVMEVKHPGGHMVPTCRGDIRDAVRSFLVSAINEATALQPVA